MAEQNITADIDFADLDQAPDGDMAKRQVRRDASDHERLLDLFWNRADLKKQFSALKRKLDDARDDVKKEQKETQRALEDKRALENMLVDPDKAFTAIVYYQLRALWDAARLKMTSFCEELANQQKDRERKRQIMEFNQQREIRLQKISAQIVAVKTEADEAKAALQLKEAEFESLGGLLNFFKRRRALPDLEQQRSHYEAVRANIEELFDRRIKIESEPWPDYPGLSAEGKRVLNLALIAMAQHLYIHFSENNLASMARVTTLKKVQEVSYGSRSDAEYLMNRIRESVRSMQEDRSFAGDLRARSKYLRTKAEYRAQEDTYPVPMSVGTIPISVPGMDIGNAVAGVPIELNVMIDDYWNLSQLLLR